MRSQQRRTAALRGAPAASVETGAGRSVVGAMTRTAGFCPLEKSGLGATTSIEGQARAVRDEDQDRRSWVE